GPAGGPEQVADGEGGGRVAAQAVDAAARRGGCRAEVDAAQRRPVGDEPPDRPEEELAKVHRAVVEIAADEVAIVPLEVGGPHDMAREHQTAKPGREALDLRLHARG